MEREPKSRRNCNIRCGGVPGNIRWGAWGFRGILYRETAELVGPSREDQSKAGGPESRDGCATKERSATPEGGRWGSQRERESA